MNNTIKACVLITLTFALPLHGATRKTAKALAGATAVILGLPTIVSIHDRVRLGPDSFNTTTMPRFRAAYEGCGFIEPYHSEKILSYEANQWAAMVADILHEYYEISGKFECTLLSSEPQTDYGIFLSQSPEGTVISSPVGSWLLPGEHKKHNPYRKRQLRDMEFCGRYMNLNARDDESCKEPPLFFISNYLYEIEKAPTIQTKKIEDPDHFIVSPPRYVQQTKRYMCREATTDICHDSPTSREATIDASRLVFSIFFERQSAETKEKLQAQRPELFAAQTDDSAHHLVE